MGIKSRDLEIEKLLEGLNENQVLDIIDEFPNEVISEKSFDFDKLDYLNDVDFFNNFFYEEYDNCTWGDCKKMFYPSEKYSCLVVVKSHCEDGYYCIMQITAKNRDFLLKIFALKNRILL